MIVLSFGTCQPTLPGAEAVLTADLSFIDETKPLASPSRQVRPLRRRRPQSRGLHRPRELFRLDYSTLFTVNVLAPWILACLMTPPRRLVYVSGGLRRIGRIENRHQRMSPSWIICNDSKLAMVILGKAVAKKWGAESQGRGGSILCRSGMVPTKMEGSSATGDRVAAGGGQLCPGDAWTLDLNGTRGSSGGLMSIFFDCDDEVPKEGAVRMKVIRRLFW